MSFLNNGKSIISIGYDNFLRIWDLKSGLENFNIPLGDGCTTMELSDDNRLLLTGGYDGIIKLYDILKYKKIMEFKHYHREIINFKFLNDSNFFLSCGKENTFRLWNKSVKKALINFEGHSAQVNSVLYIPDMEKVVSGSDDGSLRVWDISTGFEIARFDIDMEGIKCVYLSGDGKKLLTESYTGLIKIWCLEWTNNIENEKEVGISYSNFQDLNYFAIDTKYKNVDNIYDLNREAINYWKAGKKIIAVKYWEEALKNKKDNLYLLFNYGYASWLESDISGNELLKMIKALENIHKTNPDFWLLMGWIYYEMGKIDSIEKIQQSINKITNTDFLLALKDTNKPIFRLVKRIQNDSLTCVCFSRDNKYLVTADTGNNIIIWEKNTGKQIRLMKGHTDYIYSICLSNDNRYIISGGKDKRLILWNFENGTVEKEYACHENPILKVGFSKDDKYIYSFDNLVQVWNLHSSEEIRKCVSSAIAYFTFSPDGKYGIGQHDRGDIYRIDLETGMNYNIFNHDYKNDLFSITVSSDSKTVLSGSNLELVYYWDLLTGKELGLFDGHETTVSSVCFASNGEYAISIDLYSNMILWETATLREILRMKCPCEYGANIVSSPDGKNVIIYGNDNAFEIWEINLNRDSSKKYCPFPIEMNHKEY